MKTTYTLTQDGAVLIETTDGINMPADYSFETVNDYVHGVDVHFEELQCLCLGMACEIDRLNGRTSGQKALKPNAQVKRRAQPVGLNALLGAAMTTTEKWLHKLWCKQKEQAQRTSQSTCCLCS